jgi:hypothetical protein
MNVTEERKRSSAEAEHRHQRVVDTPKLFGAGMAGQITETLRVDGPDLLDEDAGCLTVHIAAGEGPEVQGPSESILMAITGRAVALDELSGPGVEVLRQRAAG